MIIVPVIIIAIIVGISFGASQFRNVDLENPDASSLGNAAADFLDLRIDLPFLQGRQEEEQQNNIPPTIQEPQ